MKIWMVATMFLLGCGGAEAPADQPDLAPVVPHNFTEINQVVFQTSCAFSVCHSPRGSHDAAHLDLTGDAFKALVMAPAENKQAKADGLQRVKPCDPDHSFLLTKLEMAASNNDSMAGYGAHMPLKNPSLPEVQLQAVRDWIARGALEDEPNDVTGSSCNKK
jgi:hypothetical protein